VSTDPRAATGIGPCTIHPTLLMWAKGQKEEKEEVKEDEEEEQ